MPPKPKITKEMILEAAYALTREAGIEAVTARTVAQRLGCSTQPVMYSFETIEALRNAVYRQAEEYQTSFIMSSQESEMPMLAIGMGYVRFAAEEPQLFRLLFQSNHFSQQTLDDVLEDASVQALIDALMQLYGISRTAAKDAFAARFLMVHGMASMLANNAMAYDQQTVRRLLEAQFGKAIIA